jgi:hypothetical protein
MRRRITVAVLALACMAAGAPMASGSRRGEVPRPARGGSEEARQARPRPQHRPGRRSHQARVEARPADRHRSRSRSCAGCSRRHRPPARAPTSRLARDCSLGLRSSASGRRLVVLTSPRQHRRARVRRQHATRRTAYGGTLLQWLRPSTGAHGGAVRPGTLSRRESGCRCASTRSTRPKVRFRVGQPG